MAHADRPKPVDPRSREARAAEFDMFARYPADHPQAGAYVSRPATCVCGREYTQHQLAPLWTELTRRKGLRAQQALERVAPDGYVPQYCLPCERDAIRAEATPPPTVPTAEQAELGL